MLANGKRLIQVRVNDFVYDYLKHYFEVFGVSISAQAEMAIITQILHQGGIENAQTQNETQSPPQSSQT